MALARRLASSAGRRSKWKAIRWADFGPIPGSRPSSSTRSWTGPSYTCLLAGRLLAEEGDDGLHHPAADGGLDRLGRQLLLGGHHVGLHLLNLLHDLVHLVLAGHDRS